MLAIRTILHPTDFSEHSQYAFEVAVALANTCGSRLAVLHVMEFPPSCHGGFRVASLQPDDQEIVLEQLISRRPANGGIPVAHHLVRGDPAVEIVRMARKANCDLIVMGSHGRTGLQRLLMGSVAEEVARNAHCPVLTVRNGTRETLPPAALKNVDMKPATV
jgi:nucleotide-binding universal stress UspA family protein